MIKRVFFVVASSIMMVSSLNLYAAQGGQTGILKKPEMRQRQQGKTQKRVRFKLPEDYNADNKRRVLREQVFTFSEVFKLRAAHACGMVSAVVMLIYFIRAYEDVSQSAFLSRLRSDHFVPLDVKNLFLSKKLPPQLQMQDMLTLFFFIKRLYVFSALNQFAGSIKHDNQKLFSCYYRFVTNFYSNDSQGRSCRIEKYCLNQLGRQPATLHEAFEIVRKHVAYEYKKFGLFLASYDFGMTQKAGEAMRIDCGDLLRIRYAVNRPFCSSRNDTVFMMLMTFIFAKFTGLYIKEAFLQDTEEEPGLMFLKEIKYVNDSLKILSPSLKTLKQEINMALVFDVFQQRCKDVNMQMVRDMKEAKTKFAHRPVAAKQHELDMVMIFFNERVKIFNQLMVEVKRQRAYYAAVRASVVPVFGTPVVMHMVPLA